jgi:hypothetical protein
MWSFFAKRRVDRFHFMKCKSHNAECAYYHISPCEIKWARKNPLGAGLVVARIAPFFVAKADERSYVKQVKADGGWLDLYRLEKMGLVPFFGGAP